jgi:signal transduction histidine kinase
MRRPPVLIVAAILLLSTDVRGSDAAALPTLTSVRQVRELSQAEAARGYPVRLRGLLTFHDWDLSFLQDATGGVYFRNKDSTVRAGTEVEVEGFTAQGRTLPIVTGPGINGGQAHMRPLGPGEWPQAISAPVAALDQDAYDAQWVSVRGKVTAVASVRDGVMLDLLSDGVLIRAAIPRWPESRMLPGYLREQTVTVHGVVSRKPAAPGEETDAAKTILCTPSLEMVEVAPDGRDSLFNRPRVTYRNLWEFTTWEKRLVRIYGQVRYARPGSGFFLVLEDTANVWVQTSAPGKIAPGDLVDAVGWNEFYDGRPVLMDAIFRVEKTAALAPRVKKTAAALKADTVSYHGTAITIEGTLVDRQRSVTEDSLVVEDQGILFLARLQNGEGGQLSVLERGTRLRLGGVCQSRRLPLRENLPSTFAFQLWLSSPADVEVIQYPPWWTVERVFWLSGVVLLFGLLAAGWAALLRRQVARQTAVIRSQLERETVAQERERIARELHDSLGQELIGIGLQLDSAAARLRAAPEVAERALDTARVMVRHSQAETKRSVADLRAEELVRGDLRSALEELAQPLVAAAGSTKLCFQVEGAPRRLEGIVEHYLLRIGQEAVANAVRHARASKIDVLICYRDREVTLSIKDDGCGFDTSEALALSSGHFGLLGLRERANNLEGRLEIVSRPGEGTAVIVSIPVKGDFER